MDIITAIVIMLVCLAVEAFFSGSEMAVVSADRMQLRHEAANGSRGAKLVLEMLEKPEWLLSTTLVGTNVAIVTNTTVATALAIELFGERFDWVAIVIVVPLIWIFGEIVAKSVFQQHANAITPKAIFFIRFASYLFYPILVAFAFLTRHLVKSTGGDDEPNPFTLREEIVTMMEMSAVDGDIDQEEQSMIRKVFNFRETTVGDVLVPLIDVVAIERVATCGEAIRLAMDKSHRRLAVYEDRVDSIVGMLDTLNLIAVDPQQPLESFVVPVRYVPPAQSVDDLLVGLRQARENVAVVVDEYGGAEGIVTIEDILEEVVGQIEDEYDGTAGSGQWVRKLAKCDYLANARIELDVLREEFGIALPEGDYETLAGFLVNAAAEIPSQGQIIRFKRYSFTIEQATDRAIQEVRIRW